MAKDDNSYKGILKGTTLFGGVEVFRILVNLVKGKFVALFLGPEGMGMAQMFTSSSLTISRFSTLGSGLAFVKETAAARDDKERLGTVLGAAFLLLRFTALLGAVITVLLSVWLSEISFGTPDLSWQFVLLAIAVFFIVLSDGEKSILQGLHVVKILSLTSLVGAVTGVVAGVPLYYFFGTRGIVPAFILVAFTTWGFYSWGLHKALPDLRRNIPKMRWRDRLPLVRRMLSLGILLMIASMIGTACNYAVNVFVRIFGNLDDVGLFSAANSVTLQYTGMLFAAVSMDYYPRLSTIVAQKGDMTSLVNKQMDIVALLAAPLCILVVICAPIVIRLLLTSEFLPALELMRWLAVSVLFKALQQPLGYIPISIGDKKIYFYVMGICDNLLFLLSAVLFYHWFGLIGLGYGAVVEQVLCLVVYLIIMKWRYGYGPSMRVMREIAVAVALTAGTFCVSLAVPGPLMWYLMGSVFLISALRSFLLLRNRIRKDKE